MLVRSSSTRLGTKLGRQVWLLLVTLAMFFFTLRLALFGEARCVLVLLLLLLLLMSGGGVTRGGGRGSRRGGGGGGGGARLWCDGDRVELHGACGLSCVRVWLLRKVWFGTLLKDRV